MTLLMDEQKLLADFRNLAPGAQKELLDYATFLSRKQRSSLGRDAECVESGCQCPLKHDEKRPESAKEPVFTE